jgi:hypothetical protein
MREKKIQSSVWLTIAMTIELYFSSVTPSLLFSPKYFSASAFGGSGDDR